MSVYGELWLCGLGILVSLLLRSCTSLHGYSGRSNPPMFGDYEAQRHWMEVTVNLAPRDWYRNSSRNDLQYWGLDYPPLTAYHSWLCGQAAKYINPRYVLLHKSRGFESPPHQIFMRYTVLLVDMLVYMPAICAYFYVLHVTSRSLRGTKSLPPSVCVVLSLLYPGIILIDHGHFQYNCVSLGLAIFAVIFILLKRHILASVMFCLALNYKHMELYHALPFFLYLLSSCVPKPGQSYKYSVYELSKIALTVIVTFGIIWSPFLVDLDVTLSVLNRLFPLARGVFEDKVSNFWCFFNIFYKFKLYFTNLEMARLCLLTTLIAVLPSSIDLFLRPSPKKFVPALINSSLAFFLFSFQVHEKSILLVAIPVILYFPQQPVVCFWFLLISNFSMLPLLIQDELCVAFFALNLFYIAAFRIAINFNNKNADNVNSNNSYIKDILITLLDAQDGTGNSLQVVNVTFDYLMKNRKIVQTVLVSIAIYLSILGCFVLFLCSLLVEPPEKYPDIFPLLISVYSFFHFVVFFVYFNICQFKIHQDLNFSFKLKHD